MHILSFLDPPNSQNIKQSTFDQVNELVPLTFNKVAAKLEHREFAVDGSIDFSQADAVKFWVNVYNMTSPMGEYKYRHLATVALKLLAIPTSNADCERAFSHVRRIKTDFRSSLTPTTISSKQNSTHMNEISHIDHLSNNLLFSICNSLIFKTK